MINVGGTWLGTYWQEGQPTRFEMTLVQGGNTLSGSILDDSHLGEATLVGEIVGRQISFVKTYLAGQHYVISYTGLVAENENYMAGDWRLQRYQGTWEAHRGQDDLNAELRARFRQKIPVGVTS